MVAAKERRDTFATLLQFWAALRNGVARFF